MIKTVQYEVRGGREDRREERGDCNLLPRRNKEEWGRKEKLIYL